MRKSMSGKYCVQKPSLVAAMSITMSHDLIEFG